MARPHPERKREVRRAALVIAPALALAYFIALGGTPFGEQLGLLRAVNSMLGAALIVLYVARAPRSNDRIDRLVLVALLLFAVTALFSRFPRQSFDALLAAVAYAALFYVARDAFQHPAVSSVLIWVMRLGSAAIAIFAAARYLPTYIEWVQLTDAAVLPPLGLPLVARPWGHAYDMVTLGIMLVPAWLLGAPAPRSRIIATAAVGGLLAIVVLLLGSRAQWLALVLATAAVFAMSRIGMGSRPTRPVLVVTAGIASLAVLAGIAVGGPVVERLFAAATINQRVEMWAATVDAWAQRPLFGFGPGTFPWVLQSTAYFDTNSIHPRHPDSAVFQVLAEAGVFGVAAAAVLVAAIVWPLVKGRQWLALWPLMVMGLTSIGGNPTDFSYLIVVAALWAAMGLPREHLATDAPTPNRPRLTLAMRVGMVAVAIPVVAMLAAGIRYDMAIGNVNRGDLTAAMQDLDDAVRLDPAMGLYVRQRGIGRMLVGDLEGAEADLRDATRLSRNDDFGWRALAIVLHERGENGEAEDALDRALDLKRSDKSNFLLRLAWQQEADGEDAPRGAIAEAVLAWPTLLAASGSSDVLGNTPAADAVSLALDRWEHGLPSPEPIRSQIAFLAALDERPDLFRDAARLAGLSEDLMEATGAVAGCEPTADALLRGLPSDDRRSSQYWALRMQRAAELGESDDRAHRLYEIDTFTNPSAETASSRLNPLQESNERGSVDAWAYDRIAIQWEPAPEYLPSPDAGRDHWLIDPRGARSAMGLSQGPGSCTAP